MPVGAEKAYSALQDPALLVQCMPGCEKLEEVGPGEYAMRMKMVLAAISGQFEGKVRIADPNPPVSFQLIVEGNGKIGFMKGTGAMQLQPVSESVTEVHYQGDVEVGGTLATVGARLIEPTSKMMIKKFFEKISTLAATAA